MNATAEIEEVRLLRCAVSEIQQLRKSNAHMSARLSMFDDMMLILRSRTPEPGGRAETIDLCYEINRYIEKISKKPDV